MHLRKAWLVVFSAVCTANAQSLFEQSFAKSETVKKESPLTAEHGPYMVKIASFTGEEGQKYANLLASELRTKQKIPAVVHHHKAVNVLADQEREELSKKFTEKFGVKPRIPRFATTPPDNWVVLAGDFVSYEDPKARALLDSVRRITPESLSPELVKRMAAEGIARPQRAFTAAMLVRNPLLPPERSVAGKPTIDRKTAQLLLKLNDQEQFSVYKCGAPYTIKVAEFRGASVTDESRAEKIFGNLKRQRNVDSHKSSLQKAAENAIILCDSLRKQGYEAYVFHGEYASIVTVGGYRRPDDDRIKADIAAIRDAMVAVAEANKKLPPDKWQVVLTPSPLPTPKRPTRK